MTKTKSSSAEKKVTIRIPENLHQLLVEAAKQDERSLNAEIVVLLRKGLATR
jgi:predicted HicB family RNase H-like nuclease